jgi:hypothetical protein
MVDFYGEGFLVPRPTPMLEDHPLSAVRDYLFNIFAVAFHIYCVLSGDVCNCAIQFFVSVLTSCNFIIIHVWAESILRMSEDRREKVAGG